MEKSRKVFIISDTHFNHSKIIDYCNRPFKNVVEMNDFILSNWNDSIEDNDIVYHLGDVYIGDVPSFLFNLKGRKRLILGNHDNPKDQILQKIFEKIMLWRKWPEYACILSHIPLHNSALLPNNKYSFKNYVNIHGHIHNNESPSIEHINVCVEKTDYKPVEIEALLERNTW